MSFTTILVYLTLSSLLFTIADVTKIKKENKRLREKIKGLEEVVYKDF